MAKLEEEIRSALNRASRENVSNTPDWILAEYLLACLNAYEAATRKRVVAADKQGKDSDRGAGV